MKLYMHMRKKITRVVGTWAVLLLFMGLSQPQNLPVIGLIVPFVLLFAAFFAVWDLAMVLRIRFLLRTETGNAHRQLGFVVCMSGVLLLILQSLGQLTVRDVITLAAIILLGYVYLARNRFSVPKR